MATRLVVDGTLRRITGPEFSSDGTHSTSSAASAAEFFRFVALRAGLPLESTADVLIADYATVLGANDGLLIDHALGLDKMELTALATVESGAPGLPPDCAECPVCFSPFTEVAARLLPCTHAPPLEPEVH